MNPRTPPTASLRCARVAACCLVPLLTLAAFGTRAAVGPAGGPAYPVSRFVVEYALDHPRHIPERDVLELEVGLTSVGTAYSAPRPVDRTVRMRLSSLPEGAVLSATAIQHINQYIVSTFNRSGYNGVIVTVPDIDEASGRDLRPPGDTTLRLRIWTGRVSRVTTLANGERFRSLGVDERTNHTAHQWIRERAPVQPGGVKGLLDVAALEDYAAQLSRHTGRRVDAELAPGRRPGTSDVNLRIAETRPWKVYAQYTNTGTSGTTKNRERFGFAHDQLLSRDDSLRVDYTTGDFDEVHVVSGSYEAPFSLAAPAYRYRLRGLYSEFDASEVAIIDSPPGTVHGEQVLGEGTLIANLFQRGEFFVDLLAGARYQQLHVDQEEILGGNNPQQAEKATVDYVVPSVGVLGERNTTTSRLRLSVDADAGFTDAGWEDRRVLGNDETAKDFALLRWDGSYSFYLEPLLDRFAWEDPGTPESSTLAHEIAVALRGQWAFDQRLVPYYQQVAGGFFTVRGYKQSSVAGDTVVLGSAEYRLHLPRIFAPDSEPPRLPLFGPFRVRPESVYGRPDWDLILRLFSDAAQVWVSDPMDAETDETLVSLGGGIEMQLLQNLSLRFDAGHVLSDAGSSEQGDTRGHVMATLVY